MILLLASAMALSFAPVVQAQDILWTRQFGTASEDRAQAVFVDASGVYVAGRTDGTLPNQSSAGSGDAFVRKYDAVGTEVWTRQFGTSALDQAFAVSVDASGVYVAGWTGATLPGQSSAGFDDAFVRKYDANGTEVWTRQFGTALFDQAYGISVDASGVYVAGWTGATLPNQSSAGGFDAFVRKYDAAGTEGWTRQFGSSANDEAYAVSVDAFGVYVAGVTFGTLPGQTSSGDRDAFVRKYDTTGAEVWTRQFGSASEEWTQAVSADVSGVYMAGWTGGTLPGQTFLGLSDAFVRKYNANGTEVWTRQFGTFEYDQAWGVSADASGAYVAGWTGATLPGQSSAGSGDAFVRKYDAAGTEDWTRQFGTEAPDEAFGVSFEASDIYVAGRTSGSFPDYTNAGLYDAFVVKLSGGEPPDTTPPVANAGPDQTVTRGATVTFDGSGSTDDVAVVNWTWVLTENNVTVQLHGPAPTHTFTTAGTYAVTLTVWDAAGNSDADIVTIIVLGPEPERRLTVDLAGEFDYLERENVRISIAALVRDAETVNSASGADVTIRIYDSTNSLRFIAPMIEVLPGTGVYRWTSPGTINQLRFLFPKGVYLAVVEASLDGGPITRAILEFHVDPPGAGFSFLDLVGAIVATAGVTALVLRRQEVAHTLRRWRKRA